MKLGCVSPNMVVSLFAETLASRMVLRSSARCVLGVSWQVWVGGRKLGMVTQSSYSALKSITGVSEILAES